MNLFTERWPWLLFTVGCVSFCCILLLKPLPVAANDDTIVVTPTVPSVGGPIIPEKPKIPATQTPPPEARLVLKRHYTTPETVRALEPFELHLEFQNVGILPAEGYSLVARQCASNEDYQFQPEDSCYKTIPRVEGGYTAIVTLRLRYLSSKDKQLPPSGNTEYFVFSVENHLSAVTSTSAEAPRIGIFILPPRHIVDPTPTLERQFDKAELIVRETWVTNPGAKGQKLFERVTLDITKSYTNAITGGPEFDIVVQLENVGNKDARNITVDFCRLGTSKNYNPVGSGCTQHIPGTLPPNGHAYTSQTVAATTTPASRGEEVGLKIGYEFHYNGQWLRQEVTDTIHVYPRQYPAIELTPTPTPNDQANGRAEPNDARCKVSVSNVNLRQGPGTNYPIVGGASLGNEFPITGRNADGSWWQLSVNGSSAWIYADLVAATNATNIALASYIPPLPATAVAQPALAVSPATASADSSPNVQVISRGTQGNQVLLDSQASTVNFQAQTVHQNQTLRSQPDEQSPLIVIEQYRTIPEDISPGEPFAIEIQLRNVGSGHANQLLLEWPDTSVVPLGSGSVQWLGNLATQSTIVASKRFVTLQSSQQPPSLLPVQIRYSHPNELPATQNESLVLIYRADTYAADDNPSNPTAGDGYQKPIWLRVAFGLFGLGAQK